MNLNPELRQWIREQVDQEVRRRTAVHPRDCCSECGGEYDNVTTGCKRCWDRHRNRKDREQMVAA